MSYRRSKKYDNEFEDKIVVLVDDGIATGATMLASAQWIKNKQHCKKLVIAVPVAPRKILDDLNQLADETIVLYSPLSFEAVGQFYQDFAQVSDNEVKEIIKNIGYNVSLKNPFVRSMISIEYIHAFLRSMRHIYFLSCICYYHFHYKNYSL
jgi:predicted phosphoribosyltransferase